MEQHPWEEQVDPQLRALYPHLSEEELREVERRFEQYLKLVTRIYTRICKDPEAYAQFQRLRQEWQSGKDEESSSPPGTPSLDS